MIHTIHVSLEKSKNNITILSSCIFCDKITKNLNIQLAVAKSSKIFLSFDWKALLHHSKL